MRSCLEVTRIRTWRQGRASMGGIRIGLATAVALVFAPVCLGAGKSKGPQIGMAKIKAGMQTPVGSENKVGPHSSPDPEREYPPPPPPHPASASISADSAWRANAQSHACLWPRAFVAWCMSLLGLPGFPSKSHPCPHQNLHLVVKIRESTCLKIDPRLDFTESDL